jgi:hypothetical protein
MFRGKLIGPLGFSHQGEYIGGRAVLGGGPGGLTARWCGPGLGRAALGCGQPLTSREFLIASLLIAGALVFYVPVVKIPRQTKPYAPVVKIIPGEYLFYVPAIILTPPAHQNKMRRG